MRHLAPCTLLLLLIGCGSTSSPDRQPQPAGGYSDEVTDQKDVVSTAEKAVALLRSRTGDDSLTLRKIEHAETQVVAGKNTRLRLLLGTGNGERDVTVVVYRNLKGEESLSEVEGL